MPDLPKPSGAIAKATPSRGSGGESFVTPASGAGRRVQSERRAARVFVATDNAAFSSLLSRRAEALGFDTVEFRDGARLTSACRFETPDAIVMTLQLGDADAWDIYAEVRRHTYGVNVPILVLTDDSDAAVLACFKEAVNFIGGACSILSGAEEHKIVQVLALLCDLPGREKGEKQAATFPTRVIWPTARPRATSAPSEARG
jgi:CheY-like chemotaxis protein